MFKGINIETSATCNLKCRLCPTTSYPAYTRNGYMSTRVLEKILDGIRPPEEPIDLTGWGEPLMNPHFPSFLDKLEKVTFTTNGHLLDSRWAEKTIDKLVNAVAFSIDAATEETYINIHGRGDSNLVWENMEGLRKSREFAGVEIPHISAHFLLMASNIRELPDFVRRAADCGADEVIVKHVALFARPGQEKEALFTGFFKHTEPDTILRDEMLRAAEEISEKAGIDLRKAGADEAEAVTGCFGEATRRPFVARDGTVSPCCVLAHQVPRLDPEGAPVTSPTLSFGSIEQTSLEEIWNQPEYEVFRKSLENKDKPAECRNCLGGWSVTVDISTSETK